MKHMLKKISLLSLVALCGVVAHSVAQGSAPLEVPVYFSLWSRFKRSQILRKQLKKIVEERNDVDVQKNASLRRLKEKQKALLAVHALHKNKIKKIRKIKKTALTRIPPITGQDTTVAGNLANWGSMTVETNVTVNNNNGGTVSAPAVQVASFTTNAALLVTTTAAQNIAQMYTDVTKPALTIANTTGTFATAPSSTRFLINGPAVHGSATGIVLSVTGNANNPAITSIGNTTTTAPALRLLNNPLAATTDSLLTIDAAGNVKQSALSLQSGFVLNGGQPGPLTIGTTTASSLSLETNSITRLSLDQNGNTIFTSSVGIGTSAPITQLEVVQNNPLLISSLAAGTSQRTLYLQGRYAYVINQNGATLQVFDVSNVTAPVLLSSVSTNGTTPDSIYVQGNYAYVVHFSSNTLIIFDISNPSAPTAVNGSGTATGSSGASYVYVQGRYAYVTNYLGTAFQVFDVSNPAAPVVVGSATTTAGLYSVYVQGRYAYATNYAASNLQVFDISNPTAPVLVNTPTATATGTNPASVYVQGRYAYVVNFGSNTLQIFDVSNPASPQLVNTGSTTTGTNPFMVVVQGRYAYVTNSGANSLQLFDVSNPAVPLSVGSVVTGSVPQGIAVQGRYAYLIASNVAALQIIDLGGAYIQQLEAGGMEVGTLATRENMTVNNDIDIKGGATVGRSLNVSGNIGVYAGGNQNAIVTSNGTASAPAYSFINTNTSTGMYSPATNQLALSTYGQARLNIDATGSVTQKSNYKAQAYLTGTQGISATTAAIIFNTKVFDPNNNFNTSTGAYTVPITGTYFINATANYTTATATTAADITGIRTLNIAVGGVAQAGYSNATTPGYSTGGVGSTNGVTGPYFVSTSGIVQLTVGQVVTITYTSTQVDTLNSSSANSTTFTIHYLSF